MLTCLRFWLIRMLAGKTPVLLNFKVTTPTNLGKDKFGLYIGKKALIVITGDIACNDELLAKARGVVETV